MGTSSSSLHIKDDFALVAQVAKELDRMLGEDFDLGGHRELGAKIAELESQRRVSASTIENLWRLVGWRNKLMHDHRYNTLQDLGTNRDEFESLYKTTRAQLLHAHDSTAETSVGFGGWALLGTALAVGAVAVAAAASTGNPSYEEDDEQRRRRRNHTTSSAW